jgi:hypothetical protein
MTVSLQDMNRRWLFKTVPVQRVSSSAQAWQWQCVCAHRDVLDSTHVFATLAECVRDARRNGFDGKVDPSEGSFTPNGYQIDVHGRVSASMMRV